MVGWIEERENMSMIASEKGGKREGKRTGREAWRERDSWRLGTGVAALTLRLPLQVLCQDFERLLVIVEKL